MLSRRAFFGATTGALVVAGGVATLGALHSRRSDMDAVVRASGARPVSGKSLRAEFRKLVMCGNRTLYVAGHGSDSNPGTELRPYREIQAAVGNSRPGDLILVDSGVYGYTQVADFHGAPDAWLGIMARDESTRALITVPPPTDNFFNLISSSFVGVFGLEVAGDQMNPNTNNSGVSVYGGSHHIVLWANHVHDFPGGGINCFDEGGSHDCVDVSYNRIHGTSRYSPHNTSGISIFAPEDLSQGASLLGGYGYRLVGNYIYDVLCTVPFLIEGYEYVTDGNGISLDKIESTYGYRKRILVENNVITGCGGRAIHAFETVNTDVIRNTAVGNLRTKSPALAEGVEMGGTTNRTVRFVQNVICPLNTANTTDANSTYENNVILGGSKPVPRGNLDLRGMGIAYFRGPLSADLLIEGTITSAFIPAES